MRSIAKRFEKCLALMESEISVLQVEKRIRTRVKRQMEKTQRRLAAAIATFEAVEPTLGALDVAFYRDDIGLRPVAPVGPTEVPDVADKVVVLVDDVLFTGRTVRAALDALLELGRPRGCSLPSWSTAVTASSRCARITSARTFRRVRPRTSGFGSPRSTATTGSTSGESPSGRSSSEAPAFGRRSGRARRDRVDARPDRFVPRGDATRYPEGSRAARQDGGLVVLRGLHPHAICRSRPRRNACPRTR